jgi:hypothetical protein
LPVACSRAKSLEQMRRGTVRMDFIITLCDVAAGESFSDWLGQPFIAHWSVESNDATGTLPQGKLSRRLLERRALTLQASYL